MDKQLAKEATKLILTISDLKRLKKLLDKDKIKFVFDDYRVPDCHPEFQFSEKDYTLNILQEAVRKSIIECEVELDRL